MTLFESFNQLIKEMAQTIGKLDRLILRLKKTQEELDEAKSLPRTMAIRDYVNVGPHLPGLG
jgi:hypothetical protein